MKNVILGKTGLKISRLGFGGIPIQQSEYRKSENIDEVYDGEGNQLY